MEENIDNKSNEFCSFYSPQMVSGEIFGLDIFSLHSPKEVSDMVKNPMYYNKELRILSNELYNSNGLFTQSVDFCTALPTLDNVVIPRGKNKSKKEANKTLATSFLKTIRHKTFIRDCLFKLQVDGMFIYYCEFTKSNKNNKKFLTDLEVYDIVQLNDVGVNACMIPLPLDYTRIIGMRNSSYEVAFDLNYFAYLDNEERDRKLRLYPKEIREGWAKYSNQKGQAIGNWLRLDSSKILTYKIKSKVEEPYGRPVVLSAIKDILYNFYFSDTCRATLDEVNNRIIYQTFPEKEKGVSALTRQQQENQHINVRDAIQNKNQRKATSFFSVACGTKIDVIGADTSLLDEKNSSYIQDQIGIDLGFMASLLSGSGSSSFASQQNNLNLILSKIMSWIEGITEELVKVINENIIKDKKYPIDLYYLPCSILTRSDFTQNMKELYLSGKGSLTAWIASTGVDTDAYVELMEYELENDWENHFICHQTSYTMSGKGESGDASEDSKGGRPEEDNPQNENTIISKANNANALPE